MRGMRPLDEALTERCLPHLTTIGWYRLHDPQVTNELATLGVSALLWPLGWLSEVVRSYKEAIATIRSLLPGGACIYSHHR